MYTYREEPRAWMFGVAGGMVILDGREPAVKAGSDKFPTHSLRIFFPPVLCRML